MPPELEPRVVVAPDVDAMSSSALAGKSAASTLDAAPEVVECPETCEGNGGVVM